MCSFAVGAMDTALGGSEDPWSGARTDALGQATSIGPGEEVVAPPVEAARGPGVVLVPPGKAVRGPGEVLAPALVAARGPGELLAPSRGPGCDGRGAPLAATCGKEPAGAAVLCVGLVAAS
jgi:hypothetical protein